jgi:uncharacterized protein YsxB (DUF464 family)
MIRGYAVQDELDSEGGCTLILTGHANEKVCAGVSAIWETALLGLQKIAKEYPGQMSFQKIEKKKRSKR